MSLYSHALLQKHTKEIGEVFKEVGADKHLLSRVKNALEDYVERFGRSNDFNSGRRGRLFREGTLPTDTSLTALLYDFLTLEFLSILRNLAGKQKARIALRNRVDELKKDVNGRINSIDNPFAVMARDIDTDDIDREVPKVFINKFYGYRRSSHGEIVRFLLQIKRSQNRERAIVSYHNIYWRGQHRWYINGAGMYAKNNVLYLFGHARDERLESTGYRVMALRQLGTTAMVCGPLITMDEVEPITARAVLIPWDKHKLTDDQKEMTSKQLMMHMIKTKRKQIHSDDYDRFIDEIRKNVSGCFPERKDQGLFHYISNLTSDVIHCVPDDDDELISEELRYRMIAHNSRQNIRGEMIKALKVHLDGKNRM